MKNSERRIIFKTQLLKRGLKQMDIAHILGVSESLLSRIVNGHIEPSPEIRKQIADILDMPEEALFGGCGACSGDCGCGQSSADMASGGH